MSDRDQPPGKDNRTIIRPNPGGRRPPQPAPPPARPETPPPWPAAPPVPPGSGRPPSSPYPASGVPTPQFPSPQQVGKGEEWIASPAPQQPAPVKPRRALAHIDELAAPNASPIMQAAGPLLLLLGRLRASLLHARFSSLMDQAAQSIQKFDHDIRAAGFPDDQANTAKYILCATADDIVQNIPAEDRHEWSRYSMLSTFFGERIGGVRFFDLVDRAKIDPVVSYPLLELQHACLALGFQGRYRSEGGGFATLQQIQRSIYETMRRVRPRTVRDLSPHWQGQALAARNTRLRVPVWAVGAVAGVLLFLLYVVLRYLLSGGAEAAAVDTLALNPRTPITIARKVAAPPPKPPAPTVAQLTQLQRIRAALAPEIAAGTVSVPDPTGPYWIVINVGDLLLFNSGEATIINKFLPLAHRIRAMLENETGTVGIVGHTDTTKLGPASPFKSNYDLSVARARNTATILAAGFSHPERFKIDGRGPDQPIGDNHTEAGRRQNRRVEVLVQRTD